MRSILASLLTLLTYAGLPSIAQTNIPTLLSPIPYSDIPGTLKARPRGHVIGRGEATWYEHPGTTASGETFDPDEMTAAHRTLEFGTKVRVVRNDTEDEVIVRINDRMGRKARADNDLIIDLSRAAAKSLGILGRGNVTLYRVDEDADVVASDY